MTNTISTVAVCGAGTMGSGIAQVAAQAGFTTILFDVNEAMLQKAKDNIEKSLQQLVAKAKLSNEQAASILHRLSFTQDIQQCKADLIIEAIVENIDAKVHLFNQLSSINNPKTILASNTSSISINQITANCTPTTQIAGLHFFNPATIMKLVEVVQGEHTSTDVVSTLVTFCQQLGKTAVVCADAPGFIVNRVARHYYLEAMQLVEQGLADIETIDAIMEASGFKMGPFKLMDLIGMDVNYSVSNIVWNALGQPERLTPSAIQAAKVAAGELGRKTGKGFYTY